LEKIQKSFFQAYNLQKKELANINLYPDPEKINLRILIAKKENLKKENIFL
jgi:histidinol-phosphate/aromatic aminotransferase/cobyric acid decarboxylase-like protein